MKEFNLVNTTNLNRILKSKIFLHIDRQLHATRHSWIYPNIHSLLVFEEHDQG